MSKIEILVRSGIGLILFGTWIFLTYFPPQNAEALLMFIQVSLGGLVGHSANAYKSGAQNG